MSKIYIYGKHAVAEALTHARHSVLKVLTAKKGVDPAVLQAIKESGVATGELDPRTITSQVEGRGAHQGVVALVSLAQLTVPFDHFIDKVTATPGTLVVFLSGVQDPHNVGTIIRSAAAFGASAVLFPVNKQSPITGAVVKASAGMAFRIPLVTVTNMQQAIAALKKKGFRTHGLAAEGTVALGNEQFAEPALVLLGNEAEGLPPAVRVLCDNMLSIPMSPLAESLNVAASAAVALYAWSQKHPRS